jgi:enoyl-CoA hydratase
MSVSTDEMGNARIISWDNQRHRNAWGRETIAAIADALDATGREPGVRCLVARGAGADFSAGDDLFEAAESDVDGFGATIDEFQRLTQVVLESLVPVIAAIDGVCIGGALEFAASCDLRIGTHRSRYATPEVRIGLGASNAGTLLLPEVLGESATRELLLTGQLKTAGWMNRHGFFNDVVDDLDAGIRDWITVFDLTTRPAVHRTKRMLNERFGDLLTQAMERETQTCVDLFPTPEAREAVERFASRRKQD